MIRLISHDRVRYREPDLFEDRAKWRSIYGGTFIVIRAYRNGYVTIRRPTARNQPAHTPIYVHASRLEKIT